MARIFAFTGAKPPSRQTPPSFVGDIDQPKTDVAIDGEVVRRDICLLGDHNTPHGDWTNSELAQLYRVESLIVQANIRISTARGVSDEGDPWFVFCRDDGEVFVHLARIDGEYLLDSPGIDKVIRGAAFEALVETFIQSVSRRTLEDSNIVELRPGALSDSVVKLHPVVLFTALIWTLYLTSDDFFGIAHAAETVAQDGSADPTTMGDHFTSTMDTLSVDDALFLLEEQIDSAATQSEPHSANPLQRVTAFSSAIAKNGFGSTFGVRCASASNAGQMPTDQVVAASLVIVAVGLGLNNGSAIFSPHVAGGSLESAISTPETTETDNSSVTPLQNGASHIQLDTNTVAANVDGAKGIFHFADILDLTFNQALLSSNGIDITKLQNIAISHDKDDVERMADAVKIQQKFDDVGHKAASAEAATAAADARSLDYMPHHQASNEIQAATTANAATTGSAASAHTNSSFDIGSVLASLDGFQKLSTEYSYMGYEVSASVATSTALSSLLSEISETLLDTSSGSTTISTASTTGLGEIQATSTKIDGQGSSPALQGSSGDQKSEHYDQSAMEFLQQFVASNNQVVVLQSADEIIVIDTTVLNDREADLHMQSWQTDDGGTVSIVGHYYEFAQFGFA